MSWFSKFFDRSSVASQVKSRAGCWRATVRRPTSGFSAVEPRNRGRGAVLTRQVFRARHWAKFARGMLIAAIQLLGLAEVRTIGPVRAQFRMPRLRAVSLFKRRFGVWPIIRPYLSHYDGKDRLSPEVQN